MRQEFDCPVCEQEVFSGIGKGCLLCGMLLENEEDFCCNNCKEKYKDIYII